MPSAGDAAVHEEQRRPVALDSAADPRTVRRRHAQHPARLPGLRHPRNLTDRTNLTHTEIHPNACARARVALSFLSEGPARLHATYVRHPFPVHGRRARGTRHAARRPPHARDSLHRPVHGRPAAEPPVRPRPEAHALGARPHNHRKHARATQIGSPFFVARRPAARQRRHRGDAHPEQPVDGPSPPPTRERRPPPRRRIFGSSLTAR